MVSGYRSCSSKNIAAIKQNNIETKYEDMHLGWTDSSFLLQIYYLASGVIKSVLTSPGFSLDSLNMVNSASKLEDYNRNINTN